MKLNLNTLKGQTIKIPRLRVTSFQIWKIPNKWDNSLTNVYFFIYLVFKIFYLLNLFNLWTFVWPFNNPINQASEWNNFSKLFYLSKHMVALSLIMFSFPSSHWSGLVCAHLEYIPGHLAVGAVTLGDHKKSFRLYQPVYGSFYRFHVLRTAAVHIPGKNILWINISLKNIDYF